MRKKKRKLFDRWNQMKRRCSNPKHPSYHNYGGRGIKVCDRWMVFENFLSDMGYPDKGMTLDRIDNNSDYSPENCKWSTRTEQNNNRRNTKKIEYKGVYKSLKDWSETLGINYRALKSRKQSGLKGEDLFYKGFYPSGNAPFHGAKLTEMNVRFIRYMRSRGMSGKLLARHYGVNPCTIYAIAKRQKWKHIK